MEKIARAGSLYCSIFRRSRGHITMSVNHQRLSPGTTHLSPDSRFPFLIKMNIGSTRSFSEDVTHMPTIKDPEIKIAIKDLLAADWSVMDHKCAQPNVVIVSPLLLQAQPQNI